MNILIYAFKVCSLTSHTSSLPSTIPWTYTSTHSKYFCQHIIHPHCPQLFHEHSHVCIQGRFTNISHILIALNSSSNILIYAFKVDSPTSHTFSLFSTFPRTYSSTLFKVCSPKFDISSLPSTLPWTSSSAHSTLLYEHSHVCLEGKFTNTHPHCPQLFLEYPHLRIQIFYCITHSRYLRQHLTHCHGSQLFHEHSQSYLACIFSSSFGDCSEKNVFYLQNSLQYTD